MSGSQKKEKININRKKRHPPFKYPAGHFSQMKSSLQKWETQQCHHLFVWRSVKRSSNQQSEQTPNMRRSECFFAHLAPTICVQPAPGKHAQLPATGHSAGHGEPSLCYELKLIQISFNRPPKTPPGRCKPSTDSRSPKYLHQTDSANAILSRWEDRFLLFPIPPSSQNPQTTL